MTAVDLPLRFQVGARTLFAVRRRLVRVALSLDDALAARVPALPPLPPGAHGYAVTSLPEAQTAALVRQGAGLIGFVRQRYTRSYIDLAGSYEGYLAGLSANTRSSLKRKAKKLAVAGAVEVRRYRTPNDLTAFHGIARAVSATTYQEKLLDAGLPEGAKFVGEMLAAAAADSVRAWTLHVGGAAVAYLYCPAVGETLIYAYLGHDPAFGELSPGTVLHGEALRDLFAEATFARFDFTEGEGQHKRQFATGGVACADLLLLRPTITNRMALAGLRGFDAAVAWGKQASDRPALRGLTRWVRRA